MTDQPTRGEFDLLREMVMTNSASVGSVASLATQMTEVVKDVAELKTDVAARFDAHTRQHEQDRRERLSGRRWLIGTGLAGLMAMSTVAGLLIEILLHTHG